MIFVDSNIPMYLVGAAHPNKTAAQILLESLIAKGERLVTDAEVLQEILHRYTDAYAPFWDSFVLSVSVLAQFLLLNRKLESWYFWLLVNTVAVPLYCSRGLWLTGALYAA